MHRKVAKNAKIKKQLLYDLCDSVVKKRLTANTTKTQICQINPLRTLRLCVKKNMHRKVAKNAKKYTLLLL
jgi:hypothetical protein